MTPTLKTFVLNKMRAYLCSKMFLCAIENALGLLVSCLKNRPIFYKNIGAYTDGLLLKNIFIGLYIRLSADAWFFGKRIKTALLMKNQRLEGLTALHESGLTNKNNQDLGNGFIGRSGLNNILMDSFKFQFFVHLN